MSTGTRIDGKAKAASLSTLIRAETETLRNDTGIVPGLTVVIVGDDPASQVYVRNKQRTAQACGFRSEQHALPADTTEDKLLALIESLNNDDSVHGILVQLPLPKHLDEQRVTQAIVPSKDVDGFHYVNIGKLSAGESRAAFVPCTPAGCMLMIEDQLGADLSGKSAVVIGRSNIVGKPMASLLLAANATVTVAHSRTRDLPGLCRQADIVVAAVGRPQMVKGDWIKPGAVVIDVGINRVETSVDGETRSRLIGDVDYDAVIDHAAAVTPVPGGVGPMTIAMLMSNTLRAAKFAAAKIQPLPGPTQADDAFRTIWLSPGDDSIVQIIDQRRLPHEYVVADLRHWQDGLAAISDMAVRGAPLIGATAAWSLYLAARSGGHDEVRQAADVLAESRPTAVNLRWAIQRMLARLESATTDEATVASMRAEAEAIVAEDVEISLGIGRSGLDLIRALANNKNGPVNILTHCNAGALATINWGTATAPVYLAHREGIDVHVWVDETRPRNQGSQLTAWELDQRGVPHTLIVDNAGGHLMQHGEVDLVITGTDRTTRHGDVANKIGTYLKALAAHDNGIPFYVALPSTTIDWSIRDGVREIPIEQRDPREVTHIYGDLNGRTVEVNTTAGNTRASNYAFDVTPARLVSGLITERGVCPASEAGLLSLFPEHGDKQ